MSRFVLIGRGSYIIPEEVASVSQYITGGQCKVHMKDKTFYELSANASDVIKTLEEHFSSKKKLIDYKKLAEDLAEALSELRDLMEDVREGNYQPDTFTVVVANNILKRYAEEII